MHINSLGRLFACCMYAGGFFKNNFKIFKGALLILILFIKLEKNCIGKKKINCMLASVSKIMEGSFLKN